jgi:hypothetical protein
MTAVFEVLIQSLMISSFVSSKTNQPCYLSSLSFLYVSELELPTTSRIAERLQLSATSLVATMAQVAFGSEPNDIDYVLMVTALCGSIRRW